MLELKNLTKIYNTKSGNVYALNGVSLTFPSTGLVFITGKSGCGKTTLLNVIGGLDDIDGGDISLFGKSFNTFSPSDYNDYRNTFVGFIFQEYNLLSEFTVEKNIELAMELQGSPCDKAELDKLLKEVGIDELKKRKPSELSGGQRQRVAIARALVKNPRIIMADEPTGALDSNTGVQVLDALKKLSQSKLVIVVSHDQDFAEKYADRIIRLVDGQVAEDVTFTESVMDANVYENDNSLLIKEGVDLTEDDKNTVAKAVKQRKKIELIDKLSYRDKVKTDQDKIEKITEKVALRKSKMKLKSSLLLGLKSMGVKPVRLIFTILLSVMAFAVFGLFDTVANFSTPNIVNNLMRKAGGTVSLYGEYIVDYDVDDAYEVKLSKEKIDQISSSTGYSIKGIYDFEDNSNGYVRNNLTIDQILTYNVVAGKNYYSKSFSGFIEFSQNEIDEDGNFSQFGYKVVCGEYPTLEYVNNVPTTESMHKIAISTYMAESIKNYLGVNPLNDKNIVELEDFIGQKLTIANIDYTIVGLIDCGELSEKYNELKESTSLKSTLRTLSDDFNKQINSGAYKCVFAPYGMLANVKLQNNNATMYYGGDSTWTLNSGADGNRSVNKYVYSSKNVEPENVMLFSDEDYQENSLNSEQVLINIANLGCFFDVEIKRLDEEGKTTAQNLISHLGNSKLDRQAQEQTLAELLQVLGMTNKTKTAKLTKVSTETRKMTAKDVKVVGVYVGLNDSRAVSTYIYRLMMNPELMQEFDVCTDQGDYSRIMLAPRSNLFGSRTIARYMIEEHGLSLVWYGNTALNTIRQNEAVIRQGADLFLYIALVLAAFSVFMLFNYIATSIVNKRQSIGVLRGLGAGGKDILTMFLIESLLIALINGIFAVCVGAIGCVFVNMYIANVMNINIPFAIFGIRQVLLIFGLSIFTGVVSSAIPILKISKEKPVDLIRKP